MGINAIEKALWQASVDPEESRCLREDPHAFLGEFRLDEEERWLVATWEVRTLLEQGVNPVVLMMAFAAVNGPVATAGYPDRVNEVETLCAGRFDGKVAVVSGAAQGIGLEVARRLGLESAAIVVADAAEGPGEEAVALLERLGVRAVSAIADLSTLAGAELAMRRAKEAFGGLDILVNNVGGAIRMKPFWYFSEEEMVAEVNRSLWPTMWCCRAAVPYLRERGGGVIVNVGSNAATDGVYRIPYSACKGAVVSLTQSLAVELACLDIRVNCVSPGATNALGRRTPRSADTDDREKQWMEQFVKLVQHEELMSTFATAREQAGVIAFLASSEASHITGEVVETGRRGPRIKDTLGFIP